YFGFDLSRELEPLPVFVGEYAEAARQLIADAAARGELRHPSVRRNQPVVDEIREVRRRLGSEVARLGQKELAAWYRARIGDLTSWDAIRATTMLVDRRDFLSADQLAAARALPDVVQVRDKDVGIEYDFEEHDDGSAVKVARLRLPEKLARTLVQEELPTLDRDLRFIVVRGARGAVRAADLLTLQERLDLPFTDEERAARDRARDEHRNRDRGGRRGRDGDGRSGSRGHGGPGGSGGGHKGRGGHRHPGKGRRRR
ncbi:MAG TPA: DEAD/DEAH box helicase, partial [Gemmatimonas sp.]